MAPSVAARRQVSYREARERVLAAARTLAAETVPLIEARGRSLAQDLVAPHALPAFRNASMDGAAVRSGDLVQAAAEAPVVLPLVETLAAGSVPRRALGSGEAMRIMTGAMLPEGADAVVPVEELEPLPAPSGVERVRFRRAVRPGENVREAGRDLAAGAIAARAGRELSAHDLALLGALGHATVPVGQRPRVAVLSTGDELLDLGDALSDGRIRDSNLPMLTMLLEEAGARVVQGARVRDDPAAVAAEVKGALEKADVVITIGGVSAGTFDPVKLSLEAIGEIELWKVAMKPGQPQAFGTPRGRLFFGLPGNPASVACVFEALVRPALRRLQGFTVLDRPSFQVRAAEPIPSREGRTDFVRARLAWRDGAWWASPAGEQISGHLTPQSQAHVLLIVPESAPRLSPGDETSALLLRWPDA